VPRRLILTAFALALLVAVVAMAYAGLASTADESLPAGVEREVRETILTFEVEKQPVVPAEYCGKALTLDRCAKLLRRHTAAIMAVAEGEAVDHGNIGWAYLDCLRLEIRQLDGALPVEWGGEIVYWDVVEDGGDRCVVRAAVQVTRSSAYWDEQAGELRAPTSFTYSSASADEFTLARSDGRWKITEVDAWMYYDVPGGLTSAP
jgi:hypothetical protein